VVRTRPSQGRCTGSTPVRAAIGIPRRWLLRQLRFRLPKTMKNTSIATIKLQPFNHYKKMNTRLRLGLFCGLVIVAIVSFAFAKTYCPLSTTYGLTTTSSTTPTKPGPLKAICHHPTPDQSTVFNILCLPPSAYNAHLQHGDTPIAFTCTKPGNQGSCTQ
jgi:hypothetical protein